MATDSKSSSKKKHWKWIVPLSLFLIVASAIGLTLLVLFRYHFSSEDYPKLAHWVGNDLLKLEEEAPRPLIIGHRGSGLPATEDGLELGTDGEILIEGEKPLLIGNTKTAIQKGIDAGSDWIEIDIRGTADGELVVFHDETIDLKTSGEGKIAKLNSTDLEGVDVLVNPFEEILLFADVMAAFGPNQKWVFDVKATGLKEELFKQIKDAGLQKENVIIFGRRKVLKEYAESDYDLGYTVTWGAKEGFRNRLRVLFSPLSVVKRCEDLGCRYLVLPIIFSDQDLVAEAIANDVEVWIYGTEAKLDHEHAAGRGISGLIVDYPSRAMETFADHPASDVQEEE